MSAAPALEYDPEEFDALTKKEWEKYRKRCKGDREKMLEINEEEKQELEKDLQKFVLEKNRPKRSVRDDKVKNVVLFGKTGHGKSSTANTILGQKEFNTSKKPGSCTVNVKPIEATINGQKYRIVDTPGLFDTVKEPKEIKFELSKVIYECVKGIDAFLYVHNGSIRFSPEEQETIREIESLFGEEVNKYSGLILTRGDEFLDDDSSLEEYVKDCSEVDALGKFIDKIGQRVVAVNNSSEKRYADRFTQKSILDIITVIQEHAKFKVYTSALFAEAKRKRDEADLIREGNIKKEKAGEDKKMRDAIQTAEGIAEKTVLKSLEKMKLEEIEEDRKSGYPKLKKYVILAMEVDEEWVKVVKRYTEFEQIAEKVVNLIALKHEMKERERISEEKEKQRQADLKRLEKFEKEKREEAEKVYLRKREEDRLAKQTLEEEIRRQDEKQKERDEAIKKRKQEMEKLKDELETAVQEKAKEYVMTHSKMQISYLDDTTLKSLARFVKSSLSYDARNQFGDDVVITAKLKKEIEILSASMDYTLTEQISRPFVAAHNAASNLVSWFWS